MKISHTLKRVSMSLDSSDTFSEAAEGKEISDGYSSRSGRKEHSEPKWVFLFTHKGKLDQVNDKLKEKFETFVHRTIVYRRDRSGEKVKKEIPTVSGLIFVRGAVAAVEKCLNDTYAGRLRLVKDYSTGRVAEISNKEMSVFMKLSTASKDGVRFMLNPLDYYAEGHQRIRIVSGSLQGCEGYIVRIHRDRKLITQIGNMTVAIGGITKESFENAEEFVDVRRGQTDGAALDCDLTEAEREIDRYFFTPSNDLEAMAIAKNLVTLVAKFQSEIRRADNRDAVDGVLLTLSEIGSRFAPKYFKSHSVGINDVCLTLVKMLNDVIEQPATDGDTRECASVGLESMMLRYPSLPTGVND